MKSNGEWIPSETLLTNARFLGLERKGNHLFDYKGHEIDLSASGDDQLSIMKNVAEQLENVAKRLARKLAGAEEISAAN